MKAVNCTCIAVLFLFVSCKVVTNSGSDSRSVTAFRIGSTEVTNWNEVVYKVYNNNTMNQIVNGDAPKFVNMGLTEGIYQQIEGPGEKDMVAQSMDFGTAEKAKAMFDKIKAEDITQAVVPSGFTDNIAILDVSGLPSVNAYAHFGQYYFQILFTGFQGDEAITTAESFLGLYRDKANRIEE